MLAVVVDVGLYLPYLTYCQVGSVSAPLAGLVLPLTERAGALLSAQVDKDRGALQLRRTSVVTLGY